jgi:hypothetical protein
MNELFNIGMWWAVSVTLGWGACYVGFKLVDRVRARGNVLHWPGEEDEPFINIALCETRSGICTHYHDIGFEALNYSGYPITGFPTLCGAEVGWDMKNQDIEATCETCREALAKMNRESEE